MPPRLLSALVSVGITFFIPIIARAEAVRHHNAWLTVALLLLLSRSFRVCVTTLQLGEA